ncbi:MAG: RluA family pseudouridine synthase [Patescibacteria group bacterium]
MAKLRISDSETSEPKIIYKDKNFLGIYKPEGMLVHSSAAADSPDGKNTLAGWLIRKFPETAGVGDDPVTRPGIVHRLDRETSGIMIAARNSEYFEYLKNLFKTRQIKKTYLAVVSGKPKEAKGTIDKPIGIKNGSVKRSVHSEKMMKSAETDYTVKKTFVSEGKEFSLVEVYPKTGRTHQIRVHLAAIGHPVVGDRLYGGKKQPDWADRLMLHAYSLEFSLNDGSRIKLETGPGESFMFHGAGK